MVQRFTLSANTRRELDKAALSLLGGPDLGGEWSCDQLVCSAKPAVCAGFFYAARFTFNFVVVRLIFTIDCIWLSLYSDRRFTPN